jgi:hypothetical protein
MPEALSCRAAQFLWGPAQNGTAPGVSEKRTLNSRPVIKLSDRPFRNFAGGEASRREPPRRELPAGQGMPL